MTDMKITGRESMSSERSTVVREASEWFARIQATQDLPAETLQAWLRWLEASPEHQRVFENIARIWHGANASVIAQPDNADAGQEYDGSISVSEWLAREEQMHAASRRDAPRSLADVGTRTRRRRRWRVGLASAAAIFVIVSLGVLGPFDRFAPTSAVSAGHFVTPTGKHSEILLADGSRITLGGRSALAVDLTSAKRTVRLESGEAFFAIHKDPARPFEVRALNGVITAIGTAFNVRAVEDRVRVTVTEGSVRVADSEGHSNGDSDGDGVSEKAPSRAGVISPPAENEMVGSGEEVEYRARRAPDAGQRLAIKQVDAEESVRWRDGWLIYHNEPLSYVIADIGRYTDLKLNVSNTAADLRFSGAIYKDRIVEWVLALPQVSPVKLIKDADQLLIQPRG